MRIGAMRHTLYLQSQASSYGNPGTWSNVATNPAIRCEMKHTSASEPTGQSGERTQAGLTITMRYRSDVTAAHRLTDGASRYFDILGAVNKDEADKWLTVTVEERVNG